MYIFAGKNQTLFVDVIPAATVFLTGSELAKVQKTETIRLGDIQDVKLRRQ